MRSRSFVLPALLLAVGCGSGPPGGSPDGGAADAAPGADRSASRDASDERPDAGHFDGDFVWPLPTSSIAITPSPDWKNRIGWNDPFIHASDRDGNQQATGPRWVKFSVLMRDPSKVYFQDSKKYPLHQDFIAAHLDPFLHKSKAEIDELSLHEQGQELILGAVLFSPDLGLQELGVQLYRQEAYHPEMARIVLALVRRGVDTSTETPTRAYYMPTDNQRSAAEANSASFAAAGFPLGVLERWTGLGGCAVSGWGLGRLVQVPGAEIEAALADGRLTAADVLLTDRAPRSLPQVAAVISTEVKNEGARAPRMARSYGVPFVQLHDAALIARAVALVGRQVVVRAQPSIDGCTTEILDAEGAFDPALKAEVLALKAPPPLVFPARSRRGSYGLSTDALSAADVNNVGERSASHGSLRRAAGIATPPAVALTVDLWDDFMTQLLGDGRSLAATISADLAPHRIPLDPPALRAALAGVRRRIIEEASFTSAQQAQITAALAGLHSASYSLRLSLNSADPTVFVAGGLLEDEVAGEAEVFAAIQRVYASVYDDRAYLERLRRGANEPLVGAGVLVQASIEGQIAQGWVTLRSGQFSRDLSFLAVPAGASFDTAQPEKVGVYTFGGNLYPSTYARSSAVVLGDQVMRIPEDYEALSRVLLTFADRYQTGGGNEFSVELEYSKLAGGTFALHSLRALPALSTTPTPTVLVAGRTRLCSAQAESGDLFSAHRLKSRWNLQNRSTSLRADALASTYYQDVRVELVDDGQVITSSGALSGRPSFSHEAEAGGGATRELWRVPLSNPLAVTLGSAHNADVGAGQQPLRTVSDGYLSFTGTWARPVFALDFNQVPGTRTMDAISLGSCPEDAVLDGRSRLVTREATAQGKHVRTRFYHPPMPHGDSAGYTAPLEAWKETTLSGFTAQPIVLHGFWSQTYRPGHHNFTEEFLFEPRLEEGLSPAVKAELEAANVQWIYVEVSYDTSSIGVMGTDGVFRML